MLIDSDQFVFVDRHLVLNNEKYITRDQAGNVTLSEYALSHNLIDKGIIAPETANLKQRIFEEYLVDKWKPENTLIKLKPVKNDQTAFGRHLCVDKHQHTA